MKLLNRLKNVDWVIALAVAFAVGMVFTPFFMTPDSSNAGDHTAQIFAAPQTT